MAFAERPAALAPVDRVCKYAFWIAAESATVHFNNAFKLRCFALVVCVEGEPVDENIAVNGT